METRRERIGNVVTISLVTVLIWIWAAGETREDITSFTDLRLVGQTKGSVQIEPSQRSPPSASRCEVPDEPSTPWPLDSASPSRSRSARLGVPADPGAARDRPARRSASYSPRQEDLPVTFLSAEPKAASIAIKSLARRAPWPSRSLLPDGVRTAGAVDVAPDGGHRSPCPPRLHDAPRPLDRRDRVRRGPRAASHPDGSRRSKRRSASLQASPTYAG